MKFDKDQLVQEFLEMVSIDSLTFSERQMADYLLGKLKGLGLHTIEDNAGDILGGNAGNLITKIEGDKSKPSLLLMAHMDTVTPGLSKRAVIRDGVIYSEGETILGSDDLAGVATILSAVRAVIKNNIPHGDIYVVFTIAEEKGLLGAKQLDYSVIKADYAFVMDNGGPIGTAAVQAPSQYKIDIRVHGILAHAGLEPEKGVSAIEVASSAIARMKLGRIDEETTANIGSVQGGLATNIVCDLVEIKAEARSRCMEKLEAQKEHMKRCFFDAANERNVSLEFLEELMYTSFDIKKESDIVSLYAKACERVGIPMILEATGGGSDTNVVNAAGIPAIDVSVGMDKVHTTEEQIKIEDMVKATELLIAVIESV